MINQQLPHSPESREPLPSSSDVEGNKGAGKASSLSEQLAGVRSANNAADIEAYLSLGKEAEEPGDGVEAEASPEESPELSAARLQLVERADDAVELIDDLVNKSNPLLNSLSALASEGNQDALVASKALLETKGTSEALRTGILGNKDGFNDVTDIESINVMLATIESSLNLIGQNVALAKQSCEQIANGQKAEDEKAHQALVEQKREENQADGEEPKAEVPEQTSNEMEAGAKKLLDWYNSLVEKIN